VDLTSLVVKGGRDLERLATLTVIQTKLAIELDPSMPVAHAFDVTPAPCHTSVNHFGGQPPGGRTEYALCEIDRSTIAITGLEIDQVTQWGELGCL